MELIAKIGFFLAVAMLIGIGIGWFMSNVFRKKSTLLEVKSLRGTISTRDKQLKGLEEMLSEQKTQLYKMTDEGIVNRHKLLKQSNMIQKQSDELYLIQDKFKQIETIEKDKVECLKSVMELNLQLKEREKEIEEYEKRLLLTKESSSDTDTSSNFEKQALEEEIKELKQLLEERHPKISDDDMIISKDQFKHIEEEFVSFNKKIELLEKEKSELSLLLEDSKEKSSGIIKKINMVFSSKDEDKLKNTNIKLQRQPKIKLV